MAGGLERGLELVDELDQRGELDGYHLLPAARAELLRRLDRPAEAARPTAARWSWWATSRSGATWSGGCGRSGRSAGQRAEVVR